MAEKTTSSAAVWVTTIFLTVVFLFAGWTKLSGNPAWESMRRHYADWFLSAIGVLEIVSALLLLLPRTAWIGAATLAVIMVGALVTHLLYDTLYVAVFDVLFLISLSALTYYRFPRKSPPT